MRYSQSLLYTKRPSIQTLLDIAVILSVIPHILVLKSFMIIYLFIALFVIIKQGKIKYQILLLSVVGVISIVLSFFSNYNFSDFSRMQFFVSLVSSLLLLAITLQRATHKINFYLKASPVMLLMLSFFFYDSILMVFYSVFVFFVFVLFSIWARMDTSFIEVLKFNIALFFLALPLVVVLFIAFPRIAYEKADFGFRADDYFGSIYSGKMSVNDNPFKRTGKVIMEVVFEDKVPSEEQLYFRGSTLYPVEDYKWEEKTTSLRTEHLTRAKDLVSYKVLFHPHGEKWLFPLGLIYEHPKSTVVQKDYTLQSKKYIFKPKRYSFQSALEYSLHTKTPEDFLHFNSELYPKTTKALQKLKDLSISQERKGYELMKFFFNQKLAYTTDPQNLDTDNVIDSFLFGAKNGYCTHYASAFAISARIVGIPSRVVTGYKADYTNKIENYLIVKQDDAHAWVELYLPKKGWTRFEPTATHYKNLDLLKKKKRFYEQQWFQEINKQYMYVKYLISNWLLGFDRIKQLDILNSLLNDTIYLIKFVLSILAVLVFSVTFFYLVRSWKSKDKLEKSMQAVHKILAKKNLTKEKNETMEHFFERSQEQAGVSLEEINRLYHSIKYSKNKDHFDALNEELNKFKQEILNGSS